MADVTSPWRSVEPLGPEAFAEMRRRAIFDCCKWDPQNGDASVIARYPLVIARASWHELTRLASALARETLAAEAELVCRPELHRRLGLPGAARRALRAAAVDGVPRGAARLMRFDFHFTCGGWRISEVNADVPGGLNEASGYPTLVAPHYPGTVPVGDPAAAYAEAIAAAAGPGGRIALLHATAHSDDRQMMTYLARCLEAVGVRPELGSPAHLRWHGARATLVTGGGGRPLDAVVRFFPAEWLGLLPRACGWPRFFAASDTPVSNPATALLVQSKRFPLVWDELDTWLPYWRALLPETRDPRRAPWRDTPDWIVKPVLGRVGEDVGIRECLAPAAWRLIARAARWCPGAWVAQRRFEVVPLEIGGVRLYPCIGVYTLGERVVGAYGRAAVRPLIDERAEDAAVLAAA